MVSIGRVLLRCVEKYGKIEICSGKSDPSVFLCFFLSRYACLDLDSTPLYLFVQQMCNIQTVMN